MSQDELGRRAGVSRGQVIRIENKERVLDVSQLDSFCKALGVGMVELLTRAEARVAADATPGVESQASGG